MPSAVASSLQTGNPMQGTVDRSPQTGSKAIQGAPFVRLSRKAQSQLFKVSGEAFGGLVDKSLKAAGGYVRSLRLTVSAVGGSSTGAVVAAADAPFNVIQSLLLRDALGQPIVQCDGYGLYLINKYSGQVAEGVQGDPTQRPGYSAIQLTSGAGAGNFSFELSIPLELDSAAYCAIASLNAAAQPALTVNLAASASLYTTAPTTMPTITVQCDQEFWAAPVQDPSISPPDVGSSHQWSQATSADSVASSSSQRVTVPRVGTWISTIIAVMRDNTSARVDDWPVSDLSMAVDGVPVVQSETFNQRASRMAKFTNGIARDTGVIAYTFRDAVKQIVSLADTHDLLLPTTPATLLELYGTFPAIANSPAQITFYVGQLYPHNAERVPYSHLAE